MQYDPKCEAKQYRRIMLDVVEISPRRFRETIISEMAYLPQLEFLHVRYGRYAYNDLLFYLYRLQKGRQFSDASLQQKYTMEITLCWLEAAHRHRSGKPYEHPKRYAEIMKERARDERHEEWCRRHPFLTKMSNFIWRYNVVPIVVGLVGCTAIYRIWACAFLQVEK